ncbi:hypothetical protein TWF132_001030 [Orbilia oligospora]|nr:hypothetical protein TWF132_001030 [Orbilia oligospora]
MDPEQESCKGDAEELPIEPVASQSELDSGYFSRDRAIASEIPWQDRLININNPVSRASKTFSGKSFFAKSKQPELLLFRDAHIPDEFYSRFQDLVQLYDRPLKSKLKPKFMSWKVKIFGENENTKRPYIVILCDAASTKKLAKFFSKKEIKQQCEGTEGLPPLPVLVITSEPRKVDADSDIPNVFGREDVLPESSSSCGESIKIVHGGKAKMATLGGIVKVTIGGEVKLYGITAGHILHEDQFDDDASIEDLSESSEPDTESEDESSSETGLIFTTASSPEIHVPTEDGGCNFGWAKIGQIMKPMAATQTSEDRNLDWCLVELADETKKRMNTVKILLDQDGMSSNGYSVSNRIDTVYLREYGDVVDKPVLYQPGTEPGYLKGTINTMPAFMHQSPSNKMARVYNMTWNSEWDQVSAGDCGSWVVDLNVGSFGRGNHSLYGHIVAVDIFDEAYVVPFEDTMEQLAKYLGADVVGLPLCEDFMSTSSVSHKTLDGKLATETSSTILREIFGYETDKDSPRDSFHGGGILRSDTRIDTPEPSTKPKPLSEFESALLGSKLEFGLNSKAALWRGFGTWRGPPDSPRLLSDAQGTPPLPYHFDYNAKLREYCQNHGLQHPVYGENEMVIPNNLGLRSKSIVAIGGILYGASLWKEMHPTKQDADQLASREALRNLIIHHRRTLDIKPGDTKPKLEKPTTLVSEEVLNQFRQKQLEMLLPKILGSQREVTQPSASNATLGPATNTNPTIGPKERNHEFSMFQEQDTPAAVRLKEWFVAARKRHPAETIDALLNKQCDLEDEMNDAKYAQESIQKEIQKVEEVFLEASIERQLVLTERRRLVREIEFLSKRLAATLLKIHKERVYLKTNGMSRASMFREPLNGQLHL